MYVCIMVYIYVLSSHICMNVCVCFCLPLTLIGYNCAINIILFYSIPNIGIKHSFPCINVCQVPREMLKTEAEGRGFQHFRRDLANVNVLENNV